MLVVNMDNWPSHLRLGDGLQLNILHQSISAHIESVL